jgi:internalin A
MAEPDQKSDQVRWLLQYRLWPCLTNDVLGWEDELGDGIPALEKALLRELAHVDMVRTPWIGRWRSVKQQLEERNDNYIEYSEFEQTCDDWEVTDKAAQQTLAEYLSDLGIALYFPEVGMQNLQVLNSCWATQAVYRINNARQLADGKGVLPLATLQDILKKTARPRTGP